MDKKRTMDRLHKLGFGKRQASTESKPSSKAEKLRELTELLKGPRSDSASSSSQQQSSAIPIPPPLPPPFPPPVPLRYKRRPKHQLSLQVLTNNDRSEHTASLPAINLDPQLSSNEKHVEPSSIKSSPPIGSLNMSLLRCNTSTPNLDKLESTKAENLHSNSSERTICLPDDELFSKLTRPKSRQIIGSYTQTTIPFRSASFSQADYLAYKYGKDRDKETINLDTNFKISGNESKEIKQKVHFDENTEKELIQSEDTKNKNKYPEKSEINLSLSESGTLSEPYFEIGTEVFEVNTNESKWDSDIITIAEEPNQEQFEEKNTKFLDELDLGKKENKGEMKIVQASEVELEPLEEEEAPLTPTKKSEEHKANTCIIPIPVYETVVKDWITTSPSEQWLQNSYDSKCNHKPENELHDFERLPLQNKDCKDCANELDRLKDVHSLLNSDDDAIKDSLSITEEPSSLEFKDQSTDVGYVEVRKRHSNNDFSNQSMSDSNPNSPLLSPNEEKRRMDKSKRRKGIYIQWPAIDNAQESTFNEDSTPDEAATPWHCEITSEAFETAAANLNMSYPDLTKIVIVPDIESNKVPEKIPLSQSDSKLLSDANSIGSNEPSSPDQEKSKPIFQKLSQRTSLTYQSSEEKDDSQASNNPLRQFRNLLIRGDSVSDNESDRASSRDRASTSPAPLLGDIDLKRYSKRPLRGPYGQMLEAEMKKLSPKVHYEELLEDLKRNEK